MFLDHVFVFHDSLTDAEQAGRALGLTETYRRRHPGQGTSNICYCFDNAFLEFLVLEDAAAARAPDIARTGLRERSRWRELGTCPIGIAWRGAPAQAAPAFPTWPYRPPYLPAGRHIPVAVESDAPTVPMLFESPAQVAPSEWTPEARNGLQHAAGYRAIRRITLVCPPDWRPGAAFRDVADDLGIRLVHGDPCGWRLSLQAEQITGETNELRIL
jgi:hypothetical protein